METRPFGKTGESFPILSLGRQRIVDGHDCPQYIPQRRTV